DAIAQGPGSGCVRAYEIALQLDEDPTNDHSGAIGGDNVSRSREADVGVIVAAESNPGTIPQAMAPESVGADVIAQDAVVDALEQPDADRIGRDDVAGSGR